MANGPLEEEKSEILSLISKIDLFISSMDALLNPGLNTQTSAELTQKVRDASPLLARVSRLLSDQVNRQVLCQETLRWSMSLVTLQSRLARKCHLATMAIILFTSTPRTSLAPSKVRRLHGPIRPNAPQPPPYSEEDLS